MLIKVNTTKHRVCYINPTHVILIDQSPVDPSEICVVVGTANIWITATEFARILPLLTDTPAPVVQVPRRVDYSIRLAPQDQIPNLLDIVIRMKKASDEFEEQEIYGELLEAIAQCMIPADVVKAYHHIRGCEQGRYTYVTEEKINVIRRDLIDLLAKYIPTEETDHE